MPTNAELRTISEENRKIKEQGEVHARVKLYRTAIMDSAKQGKNRACVPNVTTGPLHDQAVALLIEEFPEVGIELSPQPNWPEYKVMTISWEH